MKEEKKKIKLDFIRKMGKSKTYRQNAGITLIALVVTIIILLILAGVTVSLVIGQNGLIQRAQTASNTMANATANELAQMGQYDSDIETLTSGFIEGGGSQQGGAGGGSGTESNLEADKIAAVNGNTALQTVAYTPATVSTEVTIPGANNGALADQTFTQTDTSNGKKALLNNVSWYVLSADENGVNLVSSPTSSQVQFCDADGYDNCLYYLNEIATKLFANPEAGVTADRVHALNLTDIKKAAEGMNRSSYNWDTQMVQASNTDAYNNGAVGTKNYTPSNKKYPKIYTADSNGVVTANNPMDDEAVPANYSPISSDRIGSSTAASTLNVNYTYFGTSNNANTISRLGTFGSSGIGGNLFNSSGTNFWLASRGVNASSSHAGFILRVVYSGYLYGSFLALSDGYAYTPSYALRVVVSVPGSRVNIGADGKVTLK